MAYRRGSTTKKHLLAKVADKSVPCSFCGIDVDDEAIYGKLYSIGDIHCHYFCVLLSCCLIQKGKDSEGLFGFLYPDILAEIERSKKHKCSYCSKEGATLGCSVAQCRKQFHLPCGKAKNVVSLYYGNFKSFCQNHAPKQKIPEAIMEKVRERKYRLRKINEGHLNVTDIPETTCVICYEYVDGFPSPGTFWPPCCAVDAWFHRDCIQRMSLSAGIHYLKCPLCNDKGDFYRAVVNQGYYVPDRDAAWELEQNAFSEIYERKLTCSVEECRCDRGREYDEEAGSWDIKMCILCGWSGAHVGCGGPLWLCSTCAPNTPGDEQLRGLDTLSLPTSSRALRPRPRPLMTSRMSLRRTKVTTDMPSCSTNRGNYNNEETKSIEESRRELNLRTPKKSILEPELLRNIENTMISPLKLLEKGLNEKLPHADITLDGRTLGEMRDRFRKPKPLMVKKKIVDEILDGLLKDLEVNKEGKKKEPIKEAHSPEKTQVQNNVLFDISIKIEPREEEVDGVETYGTDEMEKHDKENQKIDTKKLTTVNIENDAMEISEKNQVVNIDLIKIPEVSPVKEKCAFKFGSKDKEVLENNELELNMEIFKNQYLTEVGQINNEIKKECTKTNVAKAKKGKEKLNQRKNKKHAISIRNKNINFKIKIKDDDVNFKIRNKRKRRKRKPIEVEYVIEIDDSPKVLKQYVINKSTEIEKPVTDVSPIRKKRMKLDKSPDNLKQTSISSFFTMKNN